MADELVREVLNPKIDPHTGVQEQVRHERGEHKAAAPADRSIEALVGIIPESFLSFLRSLRAP